jgi:hypothetical protein
MIKIQLNLKIIIKLTKLINLKKLGLHKLGILSINMPKIIIFKYLMCLHRYLISISKIKINNNLQIN